jgi:large subunit ribosomal protein L35
MSRPIYRYLADRKWREMKRPILMQRITQMHVVPDVLPHLDPVADVRLSFGRHKIQPGEFVDSRVSAIAPHLNVQLFSKEERLVTVVVVDADVPNLETDMFDYRCHFVAVNIPISPVKGLIQFSKLDGEKQVVLPWMPPHALKGSPYHRLSVFVLEQPEGKDLEVEKAKQKAATREKFVLRSFNDRFLLKPIGVHMFRNQWDENTAAVMKRAGLEGVDVELKRKKPESLPYKKKDGSRYR